MTERALQDATFGMARAMGFLCYHAWSSIHSPAGFPDGVLARARDHRTLFVEFKTEKGKLTEAQVAWGEALGDAWRCWRPRDLLSGEIEKALR